MERLTVIENSGAAAGTEAKAATGLLGQPFIEYQTAIKDHQRIDLAPKLIAVIEAKHYGNDPISACGPNKPPIHYRTTAESKKPAEAGFLLW
ncbi:hypothetical protein HCU74_02555 [Spongiibacter sp. KMU-166]|uniref:Uncharacterized protein n=1 Tax=Spongiibacter thalassae TaxID=2721624 RepID=A0ABX1GCS6_9GAMM|nr:hypothetical protein [Spongiibacter thalassae]NKI16293.1 hypothetical protein [Spongiibacter thalassae]